MRVLFIQDHALNESLALTELSSTLQSVGHTTRLILDAHTPDMAAQAASWRPDAVVVAASLSNHDWAYGAVRRLRATGPDPAVWLAGAHCTLFPEHALEHGGADAIVAGEAETPVLALLEHLAAGTAPNHVPGVGVHVDGEARLVAPASPLDLADRPLPDRELYWTPYPFMRRFPWKKFTTGRGCLHRCAHCLVPGVEATYTRPRARVRKKPVAAVIQELDRARRAGPLRHVHFADDLFTSDVSWIERFAEEYARHINLPFTCNSSAELMTGRVAAALERAGCHGVAIALETGDQELRRAVLARSADDARFAQAVGHAQAVGLRVMSFNMVGTPGESAAHVRRTIAMNRELGVPLQRVSLCTPVAGTALARAAEAQGLLPPGVADRPADGPLPWRRGLAWTGPDAPTDTERDELVRLYHLFRLYVRHPWVERRAGRWLQRLPPGVLAPLQALAMRDERVFNNVPLVAGLRFYRHVGSPNKRTTVTPTLM